MPADRSREPRSQPAIVIRRAESAADLDQVRRLTVGFRDWLRALYPDDPEGVDANFATVEAEMASLPGEYGPPSGRLLLAVGDRGAVGMVALRDLGRGNCEMKRMFVDPSLHGSGIGRALAEALIVEAREAGYARMRLDTGLQQVGALQLYRKLGFRGIEPYSDLPEELAAGLIFMELALQPREQPEIA